MSWADALQLAVAPSAALAGVWLGRQMQERSEREAWRQQVRVDAYTDLLDASNESVRLATALVRAPAAQREETHQKLLDEYAAVERAALEVQLVGPRQVAGRALELRNAHVTLVGGLHSDQWVEHALAHLNEDGRWPLLEEVNKASEAFVTEAVKILGTG